MGRSAWNLHDFRQSGVDGVLAEQHGVDGKRYKVEDQARWSLCMLTCWGIWKLRCTLAFESRSLRPDVVIEEIRQAFAEITGTWKPQQKLEPRVSPGRWTAPREGVIKLSCDAAWTPGSGQGDLGVVARDRQGTV